MIKVMVKLNIGALRKFQKAGKKPKMLLGKNSIGAEYSEAVFESQEEADKCLNSIECKHFMEIQGEAKESAPDKEEKKLFKKKKKSKKAKDIEFEETDEIID